MESIKRRRKILQITPQLLHMILTKGNRIDAVCTDGIPDDARFMGIVMDYQRDCYGLCFESDSWEHVPFGQMLPELLCTYIGIHTDALLQRAEEIIRQSYSSEATSWIEEYKKHQEALSASTVTVDGIPTSDSGSI